MAFLTLICLSENMPLTLPVYNQTWMVEWRPVIGRVRRRL